MNDNLISQQAVINLIRRCNSALEEPRIFNSHNSGNLFECYITELPSVNPQEPCEDANANQHNSNALNDVGQHTNALEGDLISRQAVEDKLLKLCNELEGIFANIRMQNQDESVCGLCEYDCPAPYECPGFDIENCFKLADEIRHKWQSTKDLSSVNPQKNIVNNGTMNITL